ncbi:MAG: response regulator [Deltaproteobacteria bacterium]|nr:response regulator [Deltaproteobacteria bacterium]
MKNILIVEDEFSIRESLQTWLMDLGYQVEVAREGGEALKRIGEKDFDVLILDLRLPGKDGLQVLKEARAKKPKLHGIIITAYPSVEKAVEAMKGGAVDFLPKPIDLSYLEKLVQEKTEAAKTPVKPILVVDDEPSMRESLRDWLKDSGYEVDIAPDGEVALKLISEKDYGLLVLDLKLPGKNGIEVLKEARQRRPGLRGIIITAFPSVDTAVEAMREGAVDYLPKPFTLSELEKLVAENIETAHVAILPQPVSKKAIAAILKILSRAGEDSQFLARMAESPEEALREYPDLTEEEKEAIMDGDIKKIESWVGKLDERKATWLWCRLSQEKW